MGSRSTVRCAQGVLLFALAALLAVGPGCGYVKNVCDDFRDMIILGAGVTPPVVPTGEGSSVVAGILPPSFGVYAQATDFLHLGAIMKASGDLEWDRRGCGVVADRRIKVGFGPLHYVRVQQDPIWTNDYKREGNELDGWREEMRAMKDPLFKAPAKELIYQGKQGAQPYLSRGWQGWETFAVEIAVPEPFILHSGFNLRAGLNPCEAFDFVLSLFCLDLYNDAAYETLSGEPKHGRASGARTPAAATPSAVDRFFD